MRGMRETHFGGLPVVLYFVKPPSAMVHGRGRRSRAGGAAVVSDEKKLDAVADVRPRRGGTQRQPFFGARSSPHSCGLAISGDAGHDKFTLRHDADQ